MQYPNEKRMRLAFAKRIRIKASICSVRKMESKSLHPATKSIQLYFGGLKQAKLHLAIACDLTI